MNATARPRRILLGLAALLVLWGVAIALTGGVVLDLGAIRFSSRNAVNPFILALLALGAAAAGAPAGRRRATLATDWHALASPLTRWHGRLAADRRHALTAAAAALLAVTVVLFGLLRGALVAGGADSYGYLSQAHLWATATLRVEQAMLEEPPGGVPAEALVPLGYRLSPDRRSLVPVFPPGVPMVMGLFEWIGGRQAPFVVMPLLAGLAVWLTFVLGTTLAGPGTGAAAALLLATSPAFGFQLTHAPMSDIAAAAWWTAALLLAARSSRRSAVLAGLAVALGVLTRPNLVPLALVPAAALLWRVRPAVAGTPAAVRLAVQRLVLFAAGSIPGALAVAALNSYWYGAPTASGYGALVGTFYRLDHLPSNLERYPVWLFDSQGPLIAAALAAPFVLWPRQGTSEAPARRAAVLTTTAAVVVVVLCYAFYVPFDVWWFLRFLLPAFPALMVLTAAGLVGAASRLPRAYRTPAAAVLVIIMAWQAAAFGRMTGAYDSDPEWRYASAGTFVARTLPERAVIFSMLHSGSLRYYANRITIRYDQLSAAEFGRAAGDLRARGYVPYLLLDPGEAADFRQRFAGTSVGAIESTQPRAVVDEVRLYEIGPAPGEP